MPPRLIHNGYFAEIHDTHVAIDGKPTFDVTEASFTEETVELVVFLRAREGQTHDEQMAPYLGANSIAIRIDAGPISKPATILERTFSRLRLVSKRYECKKVWLPSLEPSDDEKATYPRVGRNSDVWVCRLTYGKQD